MDGQDEKFVDTKKRLQARLGLSDKDIAKYRFALIQVHQFKQPTYIEDGSSSHTVTNFSADEACTDDTIYEHKFMPEDVLGLDHLDKSGKSRQGNSEKAIVIKG